MKSVGAINHLITLLSKKKTLEFDNVGATFALLITIIFDSRLTHKLIHRKHFDRVWLVWWSFQ